MSFRSRSLFAATLFAILSFGGAALANPGTADAVVPEVRPENGYWSESHARWFISTKTDLGLYVKPYFSAGFGMPHWLWVGADVNGIVTSELGQVYAGVRAASPLLDLAFGVRDTLSWDKPFLVPQASYTASDVLNADGARARYWAWEAEVVGVVPLPYSAILLNAIAVGTLDVPRDRYVYDESYRAIIAKQSYQILRAATVARVLREDALKVGLLYELLVSTGREDNVFRLGPAASLQITDHLEAVAALSIAVHSPDSLGILLGTYGLAGLRYRWATGERKPEFPWQGRLIP